jgi:hypothetical protein
MGYYTRRVLPFIYDKGGNTPEFNGYRRRLLATARGRVLEIGFGPGLSAPFYPQTVEQVVAISHETDDDLHDEVAELCVEDKN